MNASNPHYAAQSPSRGVNRCQSFSGSANPLSSSAPAIEKDDANMETVCVCWTEDMQCFSFSLKYAEQRASQLTDALKARAWSTKTLFAFSYAPALRDISPPSPSTSTSSSCSPFLSPSSFTSNVACSSSYMHTLQKEYARMGIAHTPREPARGWRITRINHDFSLCPTYPRSLVVPSTITDENLKAAAAFRTKKRLPVLCWRADFNLRTLDTVVFSSSSPSSPPSSFSSPSTSSKNHHSIRSVALLRSSQPKTASFKNFFGVGNNSKGDVALLLGALRSEGDKKMNRKFHIFDARPYANAVANQGKGGGYESGSNYGFASFEFLNMENIHVVRKAFVNLHGIVASSGLSLTKDSRKQVR